MPPKLHWVRLVCQGHNKGFKTYRYILSLNETIVWLVLAGGTLLEVPDEPLLFNMSISHRLSGSRNWFRSNADKSFMKMPSTWPPKM